MRAKVRKRRLAGERASHTHYDKHKRMLSYGCDYWDAEAPAIPILEEDKPKWDDVKDVWGYLWRDERIILRLVREGKTPTDVAEIMRLPDRFEAHQEITRTVKVVAFYVEWGWAVTRLCSLTDVLSAKYKRIAILRTRYRKSAADIAERIGCPVDTVYKILGRQIPVALRSVGEDLLADFMIACSKAQVLRMWAHNPGRKGGRTDRRVNMLEAWRGELKKYVLANLGKMFYQWGGQDLARGEVDCSGFVIEVLKRFGVLPAGFKDTTAQGLSEYFRATTVDPNVGDLVFFGANKKTVVHVMMFVGQVDGQKGRADRGYVVGMCGGKKNMKVEWARKVGAGLWLRSMKYRRDYLFARGVH